MKIVFVIIAHDQPQRVADLAGIFEKANHRSVIHFDKKSPNEHFERLKELLAPIQKSVLFADRVAVEWGRWSMVQATLNCLQSLENSDFNPDYVYLISGSDFPIRPIDALEDYLFRNNGCEFIESWPAEMVKWVKIGDQRGRYQYKHRISQKKHYFLFRMSFLFRKQIPFLMRRFPENLRPYIGSQWWALTWSTCQKVLQFGLKRPEIIEFFKTVHIPDEMYFQTVAKNLVEHSQVKCKTLTFSEFDDFGNAITFDDRHIDFLSEQPFFFARKLSSKSDKLITTLKTRINNNNVEQAYEDEEYGLKLGSFKELYQKGKLIL